MTKIGFTGTHRGMTDSQKAALRVLIGEMQPDEFHHGDCIGADAEAHGLVKDILPRCKVVSHPPIRTGSRAFCAADLELLPATYIRRNRDIVADTTCLIATPYEQREQARGGTWSTVRFALRTMRRVILIEPDGNCVTWNAAASGI